MKKILFFIPNLGEGGAEKVLVNLVNSLDFEKYNVTVYCLFDVGINKTRLDSKIKYKYFFKKQFRGNIHFLKIFTPNYLYKKIIGNEFYDFVISYLEGPTTRIISGSTNTNTKKINWIHTDVSKNNASFKSYRSIEEMKNCFTKYDKTVFVSEVAKKEFLKLNLINKEKSDVLYNLIDIEEVKSKSEINYDDLNYIDNTKVNFLSVGRLTKVKGFERLINVFSEVVKIDQKVHLYIIGKGELEKKLNRIIVEKKMEKFISLLGYKSNPYPYMKKSDYIICASYTEGYSSVAAESVILGKKIIATNCSGMEEIIKNDCHGMIVENDEISIYNGILKVLDKNEKNLKKTEQYIFSDNKYKKDKISLFEIFLNRI